MRDVMEEMSLNGIRPGRQTYHLGLMAATKSRKLGDALYFWEEMLRHGVQPDVRERSSTRSSSSRGT